MQPSSPSPYAHLSEIATGLLAQGAWIALALWLVASIPWLVRRARAQPREVLLLGALTLTALLLRLSLPWGPLNFGEAERLDALWSPTSTGCSTMCTVPMAASLARRVGLSLDAVLRYGPPLAGALGVAGTYLLARAAGMGVPGSAVGAAVLLTWPAHAHYSTSLTFSVEGATVWSFALAAVLAPQGALPMRAPLTAVLLLLGVLTRPEFRLLLVPAGLAMLVARWTWRERALCIGALAVALIPYLQYLAPSNLSPSGEGERFLRIFLLSTPGLCPAVWVLLAGPGMISGLARRDTRLGTALVALAGLTLLLVYSQLASEANPRWGQWRYFVTALPFVAFGVAALADVLDARLQRWRRAVAPTFIALAALTLAMSLRDLRRVEDHVAEFHYLRESVSRVTRGRPDILLLTNGDRPGLRDVRVEMLPRMALATRLGALPLPAGCDAKSRETPPLRDLEQIVSECPNLIRDNSVVYLGLSRTEAREAVVRRAFDLVPIEERVTRVALSSWVINKQWVGQRLFTDMVEGPSAPDLTVRLGWYRLVRRSAPAR